ncbi:MAG: hypothetical protein KDA78_00515 [Planctomycetaceae bacterium]|nr:hypothetical protein [Planctomycetaceae bacterium]
MIASISVCPKCNALILEDTALCPHCHHVLQEGAEHLADVYKKTDERFDGSQEAPCRECKAMNREGSVRCWQCGAFLKEEIEKIYQEMQLRPATIISTVDQSEYLESDVDELPQLSEMDAGPESDADFELNEDFAMYEVGEDWAPTDAQYAPAFEDDEDELSDEGEQQAAEESEPEPDPEEELLKLAAHEEKAATRKDTVRKKRRIKRGFTIKAPCGCKIRVQNYHQGKVGFCPKCNVPFMVPVIQKPSKAEDQSGKAAIEPLSNEQLITDVRWVEIATAKFKPKANCLKGKGDVVDAVRWNDELILVWQKQKGLKGKPEEQKATLRSNIATHVRANRPQRALPTDRFEVISAEKWNTLKVIQPGSAESLTAGEEVFGPGMIAIELPPPPAEPVVETTHPAAKKGKKPKKPKKPAAPPIPPTRCLVLTISQYREFQKWAAAQTGQEQALLVEGVPLTDEVVSRTCALSEHEFEVLADPGYLQHDPKTPLVEVGWACQCGEVFICEEHRAEQKFGGKKPAGLAKAKCPKCEQKFGNNPLFHLKSVVAPEPEPVPEEKAEKGKAEAKAKSGGLGGLFGKKKKAAADTPEESAGTESAGADDATVAKADDAENKATETATPKKRKSLFGRKKDDADVSETAAPADTASAEGEAPEKKKRGSLFGRKKKDAQQEDSTAVEESPEKAATEVKPAKKEKGSLFGRKKKDPETPAEPAEAESASTEEAPVAKKKSLFGRKKKEQTAEAETAADDVPKAETPEADKPAKSKSLFGWKKSKKDDSGSEEAKA